MSAVSSIADEDAFDISAVFEPKIQVAGFALSFDEKPSYRLGFAFSSAIFANISRDFVSRSFIQFRTLAPQFGKLLRRERLRTWGDLGHGLPMLRESDGLIATQHCRQQFSRLASQLCQRGVHSRYSGYF